jgi:hypothetical protein
MKTTVEINDDLLASAKALAANRKQPLRRVLEDALVLLLRQQGQALDGRIRLRKHTFGGNGLRPEFRESGWGSIREYACDGRGGVGRRE